MKFIKIIFSMLALSMVAACGVAPGPGQEAVLIQKPWFFGHGGVVPEPVKTGLAIVAPTTDAVYVDMKPKQFTIQFDDLMSADGIPLDFDAVVRLQITDSVKLISTVGENFYANNIQAEFSNRVRQAVRKYQMKETAIDGSAIEKIDAEVTAQLNAYLKQADIPVKLLAVTVGKANPPQGIKNQRTKTAEEQQRRATEKETKLAEEARKEAETARAAADNAYRLALGLSAQQFVALQQIEMQKAVCGKGNCTFIIGDATPVINTK